MIRLVKDWKNWLFTWIPFLELVYLLFGELGRKKLLVCVIWTLLTIFWYCRRGEFGKINWKERIGFTVPIVLLYVFMSIFYFPNELYLSNKDEFPIKYDVFFITTVGTTLLMFVLCCSIILLIRNDAAYSLCNIGLFALSIAGYIQSVFLNGALMSMDGSVQTWTLFARFLNGLIWIVLIGGCFGIYFYRKEIAPKGIRMISIYLFLVQFVSIAFMLISSGVMAKNNAELRLNEEGKLSVSKNENVILFIVDWFDGQIMDKLIAEDQTFTEPLQDFVYYSNATSRYAYTEQSVPYLLTGIRYHKDMNAAEYRDMAYEQSDFLQEVNQNGYSIGVYTNTKYVSKSMDKWIINDFVQDRNEGFDYFRLAALNVRTSRYKMMPYVLKAKYWYDTGNFDSIVADSRYNNTDIQLYQEIKKDGLYFEEGDKDKAFRFIHLNGAHEPYTMDENVEEFLPDNSLTIEQKMLSQAKGSMKIIYEYLEQMKGLGVYDEAMIVIVADHGQNYLQNEEYLKKLDELGLNKTSNPVLLIKYPGQVYEEGLKENTAPVSHDNLITTLANAMGVSPMNSNVAVEKVGEQERIIREFEYGRLPDIPYVKYLINGSVKDWNNWSVENDS